MNKSEEIQAIKAKAFAKEVLSAMDMVGLTPNERLTVISHLLQFHIKKYNVADPKDFLKFITTSTLIMIKRDVTLNDSELISGDGDNINIIVEQEK